MIRVHLPDDELRRLEAAFREATDRRPRDRLRIVLVAHRGRPHGQSAADLGASRRPLPRRGPLPRWLNAYSDRGLGGLVPRKARGGHAQGAGRAGRRGPGVGH